jgi:hypothetical protein
MYFQQVSSYNRGKLYRVGDPAFLERLMDNLFVAGEGVEGRPNLDRARPGPNSSQPYCSPHSSTPDNTSLQVHSGIIK